MKLFCMVIFAALLPGQNQGRGAAGPAVIPEAEKAEIAALLPLPTSLGLKLKGPARFYSSDLSEYLNGKAEAYLQYRLIAMVHQEYQSASTAATVDVYDMGDPLHAYGIYAAERSPDERFVEIGGEGYMRKGLLNFFQRQYYVKISLTGGKAPAAPMLETMAKYVSQKIWTGTEIPKEIAWFPSRGLVPHSQKLVVWSPMGHDFLAPAATALYRFGGQETTLLVSMAASPQDAKARVALLKQSFANSGGAAAVAGMPLEAWRGKSQDRGEVIFFARGLYAVVLVHPPSQPREFLTQIAAVVKD